MEGRICQANEAVLRILGSLRAVETDAYGEVLQWWLENEEALKGDRSSLARTLATGESTHDEIVRVPGVDGTTKHLVESTSPLRDLAGTVVGAVIVLRDVTERKRVEADFEERVARLVSIGIELESATRGVRPPAA